MSGTNFTLELPPGVMRDMSQHTTGMRWYDVNQVRWNTQNILMPIGGWRAMASITATAPIRAAHSWRANDYIAYAVVGTIDKAVIIKTTDLSQYDITPSDLYWEPANPRGYSAGNYGMGLYSFDVPNENYLHKFTDATWSFDNWGEDLLGVHTADGRLLQWLPTTPSTDFVEVTNAPEDNALVIVSNERHAFVMGGEGNPRRVKWCSREALTVWTAAADNSAGGFDLETSGIILAAVKVPQGILVLTDIDVHIIEYIGPPNYYSRRLVSKETGIAGPKAVAPTSNGAMFCGLSNFWEFNNGIFPVNCTVMSDVFNRGNLSRPVSLVMGQNEFAREVWFFYPGAEQNEPDRYVMYHPERQWWSKGNFGRTAWLNAIWQDKPYAASGPILYEHEYGWLAAGASRNGTITAETGAIELNAGTARTRVDRLYSDTIDFTDLTGENDSVVDPIPYNLEFHLADAPQAPYTIYGPVTLNATKGHTTVRFQARTMHVKLNQIVDTGWGFGTMHMRVKAGARR